jgi:hypothetical protein
MFRTPRIRLSVSRLSRGARRAGNLDRWPTTIPM